MKLNHLFTALLCLILISSCTIQKRTVNRGYFVQWHWDKKVKNDKQEETAIVKSEDFAEEVTMADPIAARLEAQDSESGVHVQEETLTAVSEQSQLKGVGTLSHADGEMMANDYATKCFVSNVKEDQKTQKTGIKPAPAMDGELWINIALTVVFLALAILFLILALNAAGILMWVYWGACALSFVLFVTQVIDLIMW